ncbi:MAG: hypothetical protein DWI22_16625 [Planctomycetota bacterium]|nr:MAG: hypothetical protein DWI22_16625 [Planctomycetota bacterium]
MNSHDINCLNSDEWHKNLLDGCKDVATRLTNVIDLLKVCHPGEMPLSRRLRLAGMSDEMPFPITMKTVG